MVTRNTTIYDGQARADTLANGDTEYMTVYSGGTGTVNVGGQDAVNVVALGLKGDPAHATVNLSHTFDIATGHFDASNASLAVNGPGAWVNTGSTITNDASAIVSSSVMGAGEFEVSNGARLSFLKGVAHAQTVHLDSGGTVLVGDVGLYQAATVMNTAPGEKLDLFLPTAASWKNMGGGTLDFFDVSSKVVGVLNRLTVLDLQGFHVDKGAPGSGTVEIITNKFVQEGANGTLPHHN